MWPWQETAAPHGWTKEELQNLQFGLGQVEEGLGQVEERLQKQQAPEVKSSQYCHASQRKFSWNTSKTNVRAHHHHHHHHHNSSKCAHFGQKSGACIFSGSLAELVHLEILDYCWCVSCGCRSRFVAFL